MARRNKRSKVATRSIVLIATFDALFYFLVLPDAS